MDIHPGQLVQLPPLKGADGPSYAMILDAPTPHTTRIIITADSGGRAKGARFAVPRTLLAERAQGRHRRHGERARWHPW